MNIYEVEITDRCRFRTWSILRKSSIYSLLDHANQFRIMLCHNFMSILDKQSAKLELEDRSQMLDRKEICDKTKEWAKAAKFLRTEQIDLHIKLRHDNF